MAVHGMSRPGTSTSWTAVSGDRSFILTVVGPAVGLVGESDEQGQLIVECWKVVGRWMSGCDGMIGIR